MLHLRSKDRGTAAKAMFLCILLMFAFNSVEFIVQIYASISVMHLFSSSSVSFISRSVFMKRQLTIITGSLGPYIVGIHLSSKLKKSSE